MQEFMWLTVMVLKVLLLLEFKASNICLITACRKGQFVGAFGSNPIFSACCGYEYWSKAPTCLNQLFSKINERGGAGCDMIDKKLILNIADPLLTSPKYAHSHLLLMYWPSVIDLPVATTRFATNPRSQNQMNTVPYLSPRSCLDSCGTRRCFWINIDIKGCHNYE